MTNVPGEQDAAAANRVEAIKDVCVHSMAEPAAIWDELQTRGIDATPAEVCSAMHEVMTHPENAHGETPAVGLAAKDLEELATLAAKAGGVEPLRQCLAALGRLPQ